MRKLAHILLLLSLSIIIARPTDAQQTRPRRTGQPAGTQTAAPSPTPLPSDDQSEGLDADDVIRIDTTLITVPVNVTDRNGKYVGNLRQQDFRIYEDGSEQEIAYFASVDKPFAVALLLDTSDSTSFKLQEIQDAAIAFLDQLRPEDKIMIVTFNSKVEVLSEPTSDRNRLRAAIRRAESNRGTLLYRAVDFSINRRLNEIPGRKAIILFTDGIDSAGRRELYDKNIRDAEASDVLIYPIQYGTSLVINNKRRAQMKELANAYLHDVAEKTGARYFNADTPQNLSRAFAFIAEELRRQYSLGYYPKTTARTGQRRQIKVTLRSRPDLIVRARDSYVSSSQKSEVSSQ
ncbi:MAG: VWA domain-containing protein [Pyrinomonadaceae bacterium]